MSLESWLLYLSFVFIATATPGPAVFFIMTKSSIHGWQKAGFSALGNICGLFILGLIAVTGLGAVLKASEPVFNLLKYAGAAYLIYLGLVQFFQTPHHKMGPVDILENKGKTPDVSSFKIFIQALGVAISNPKAIVFLTALFPQFIRVDQALIPQFMGLVITLMAFSFSFLMFYAFLAHTAKNWLAAPARQKWFNRASGSAFVGFGLLMATSSRN
jgi:threonine/homoserine/homoserine lactone efflux protein